MGGGISRPQGGGFRIFKICRNSPAERSGLEVFFDFIIQIEDVCFLDDSAENQHRFFTLINSCMDKQIKMIVFNVRKRSVRDVWIIPSKWGGAGLLGATVRYDSIENALTQGIRVLEVSADSPADKAGLHPNTDFLLGTDESVLSELDELVELVGNSIDEPLRLNVYNSTDQNIREVRLVPTHRWGGKGCIGCDIGTGFLHKIPPARDEGDQSQSPIATSEDVVEQSQISAAQLQQSQPQGTAPFQETSTEVMETVSETGDVNASQNAPLTPDSTGDDKALMTKIQQQLQTSNTIMSSSPANQTQEAEVVIPSVAGPEGKLVSATTQPLQIETASFQQFPTYPAVFNQVASNPTTECRVAEQPTPQKMLSPNDDFGCASCPAFDSSSAFLGFNAVDNFADNSSSLRAFYGLPAAPRPGVIYATSGTDNHCSNLPLHT